MAVELAPDRIRVNAIAPVAGETPLLATFMGEDTPEKRAAFRASIPWGRLSLPTTSPRPRSTVLRRGGDGDRNGAAGGRRPLYLSLRDALAQNPATLGEAGSQREVKASAQESAGSMVYDIYVATSVSWLTLTERIRKNGRRRTNGQSRVRLPHGVERVAISI